jgi:hypothetical protein
MENVQRAWPSDTFDAVAILAADGKFEIEGTDQPEVVLEAEAGTGFQGDVDVQQVGRWLRIQPLSRRGEVQLRLRLPKQKVWVLELAAARGQVQISGVQARLQVGLGKGEVEVQDWAEAEVPERPAVPQPEMAGAGAPHEFAWGAPPPPPPPPPHPGARASGEFTWAWGPGEAGRWLDWVHEWVGSMPWQEWRGWVQDWLVSAPWQEWVGTAWGRWGEFLTKESRGLSLYLGRGNVAIAQSEAGSCRVWIGKGDFQLRGGRIDQLQAHLGHGDIRSDAAPTSSSTWSIDSRRGDIEIGLPGDAEARLDVATRHGVIRSDFPLVRVGRPGPEARHGGRMVGNIGGGESPSQINLSTMHGDIVIRRTTTTGGDWTREEATGAGPSETIPVAREEAREESVESAPSEEPPVPTAIAESMPASSAEATPPAGDSRLQILESLSRGEISVEEASRLLDKIG